MNLTIYKLCEKAADLKYNGIMELTREMDNYSFYLGLRTVGKGKNPDEAMANALIKMLRSEVSEVEEENE